MKLKLSYNNVCQVIKEFVSRRPGCKKVEIWRALIDAIPIPAHYGDRVQHYKKRDQYIKEALEELCINKGTRVRHEWHLKEDA